MDAERNEERLYPSVGIECGTIELPTGPVEVIGLMFANETSHIDDVYELRYMTIPAAKALILDLKDAIDACMAHQEGEG